MNLVSDTKALRLLTIRTSLMDYSAEMLIPFVGKLYVASDGIIVQQFELHSSPPASIAIATTTLGSCHGHDCCHRELYPENSARQAAKRGTSSSVKITIPRFTKDRMGVYHMIID